MAHTVRQITNIRTNAAVKCFVKCGKLARQRTYHLFLENKLPSVIYKNACLDPYLTFHKNKKNDVPVTHILSTLSSTEMYSKGASVTE